MHVLITAASRHGSTREIATAIAAGLTARGHQAEVVDPQEVASLEEYDAVVLGSAVYAGGWLEPARGLAKRLAAQLASRPVWVFSAGMTFAAGPKQVTAAPVAVTELAERCGALGQALFAGHLHTQGLGPLERLMIRAVKPPVGDHRDWRAIDAYAAEIATHLTAFEAAHAELARRPSTHDEHRASPAVQVYDQHA